MLHRRRLPPSSKPKCTGYVVRISYKASLTGLLACTGTRRELQELSAKINHSIERQVAAAASSGKLTIMKNVAMEG